MMVEYNMKEKHDLFRKIIIKIINYEDNDEDMLLFKQLFEKIIDKEGNVI